MEVNNSFLTNYKSGAFVMYSLITKLICWRTTCIVNLHDFYLLNLWNFLLGGLGWSSHTVNVETELANFAKKLCVHVKAIRDCVDNLFLCNSRQRNRACD